MSNTSTPSPSRLDTFMAEHTEFLSHSDTTEPPNTECPVCVEGIEEHICVKIVNIEGCTHLIGLECLKAMFEHMPDAEKKCPLCRTQWAPGHVAPYSTFLRPDIHVPHGHWQDAIPGHRNYFGVDIQFGGPGRDAFMQLSNRLFDAERDAFMLAPLANRPPMTDAERDAFMLAPLLNGNFLQHIEVPQRGSSLHHTGSSRGWQSGQPRNADSHASHDPLQDAFFEGFMGHFFGLGEEQDARGGRDSRGSHGSRHGHGTPRGGRDHCHGGRY